MSNIIINNSKVVVQNTTPPPQSQESDIHFKRCLRIGKLRFYVTYNYRLRNSQKRDRGCDHVKAIRTKEKVFYKRSKGRCELCGKEIKYNESQIHHVLPYSVFREFEFDERNLLCLCKECHRSIHRNPFFDCKLQRKKAKELGVNLKEYYYD